MMLYLGWQRQIYIIIIMIPVATGIMLNDENNAYEETKKKY